MTDESELLRPRKTPCATCPYRRDVPSGVWDASEYEKLPAYDGTTGEQAHAGAWGLFMCHQQDGCLCSGWVATIDKRENLALRLHGNEVDFGAVLDYSTRVPLFESGQEARDHGLRDLEDPGEGAQRAIDKLVRAREARGELDGEEG